MAPQEVEAGPTGLRVSVKVPGPLTVRRPCGHPLSAWLVDRDGHRVKTANIGNGCSGPTGRVKIARGARRTFVVLIAFAPRPGSYEVRGLLRTAAPVGVHDIPSVRITLPWS